MKIASNSKICLHHNQLPAREQQDWANKKNFHTILKDWLSRCNHNKRKTVASHITHLMRSLALLLTIPLATTDRKL